MGGVTLIDGVTFTVRAGEKVGLVGRNGAGKTSMLKVIGGANEAAGGIGQLLRAASATCPRTPASTWSPTTSPPCATCCRAGASTRRSTAWRSSSWPWRTTPPTRNIERYTRAHERFRMDGGYSAESEVRRLAAGIGLADEKLDLPLGALSGGQRRRVEVVRILFAGSDVLLLDEPTNHLDADAKVWMLDFLAGYRGALIVISHDLDLLDEAITRVIHLDRGGDTATGTMLEYKGTYSQYVDAREADEVRLAKEIAMQAKEIDRLQNIVDRFGAKATKASMAHSLEKRIDRLKESGPDVRAGPQDAQAAPARAAPQRPHGARGQGPGGQLPGPRRVRGRHLRRRPGRPRAGDGPQRRRQDQPAAGAGRRHRADHRHGQVGHGRVGRATTPRSTRASAPGANLVEHMQEATGGMGDGEIRGLLGMFGLVGDKVFQDASTLSRRREDQAGPGPAGRRQAQRAAARRAHQQPRPRLAHRRGRLAQRAGAAPSSW